MYSDDETYAGSDEEDEEGLTTLKVNVKKNKEKKTEYEKISRVKRGEYSVNKGNSFIRIKNPDEAEEDLFPMDPTTNSTKEIRKSPKYKDENRKIIRNQVPEMLERLRAKSPRNKQNMSEEIPEGSNTEGRISGGSKNASNSPRSRTADRNRDGSKNDFNGNNIDTEFIENNAGKRSATLNRNEESNSEVVGSNRNYRTPSGRYNDNSYYSSKQGNKQYNEKNGTPLVTNNQTVKNDRNKVGLSKNLDGSLGSEDVSKFSDEDIGNKLIKNDNQDISSKNIQNINSKNQYMNINNNRNNHNYPNSVSDNNNRSLQYNNRSNFNLNNPNDNSPRENFIVNSSSPRRTGNKNIIKLNNRETVDCSTELYQLNYPPNYNALNPPKMYSISSIDYLTPKDRVNLPMRKYINEKIDVNEAIKKNESANIDEKSSIIYDENSNFSLISVINSNLDDENKENMRNGIKGIRLDNSVITYEDSVINVREDIYIRIL